MIYKIEDINEPTVIGSIDWLSVTDLLGNKSHYTIGNINDWRSVKGKLGYDTGLKHVTGVLRLQHSTRKDMGIHIVYSGKSLNRIVRDFEVDKLDILKHHIDSLDSVARLDICLDFVNCDLNVQDFVNAWIMKSVKTRAKSATSVQSVTHSGSTFYIGSQKKRKKLLRIYDKGAEQNLKGIDWLRIEMQIMGSPATKTAKSLISSADRATFIAQVICGYCDFPTIKPLQDAKNGNEIIEIGSISSVKGDSRIWLEKQVIPVLAREIVADYQYWIQFSLMLEKKMREIGDKNVL